jgi:hypothetical protein
MAAPPLEGLLVILHELSFLLAVAVWRYDLHEHGGVLNLCAAIRCAKWFRQRRR